jgi:hypothetical protein
MSRQQMTIQASEFIAEDIVKYSVPKANASGGKSLGLLNKHINTAIRLVTPVMLTWGASDYEGNERYDMSLQFPGSEYRNDTMQNFLDNMISFEDKIKADALTYSKEWFNKVHKSSEVIDALWTPMLKYPKDKETGEQDLSKSPTLRVKIPQWEGQWKCDIYDEKQNKIFSQKDLNPEHSPLDFLTKGKNVATMIQCGGLWFANGKFGITWKLVQAIVQSPKNQLEDKCYISLSCDDKESIKNTLGGETSNNDETNCIVEDTDDEEEVEEVEVEVEVEVEEEEETVTPSKKKGGRKSKKA